MARNDNAFAQVRDQSTPLERQQLLSFANNVEAQLQHDIAAAERATAAANAIAAKERA